MSHRRLSLLVLASGVLGSQAGHLLAYELRFGGAAQELQSTGAHAYFPSLAKTALGLGSIALLVSLLVVGAARVVARKPIAGASRPSFVRLLAGVYTLQLALFAAQETAEAMAGGGYAASAPLLLMWGALGQLPVAIAATLALRWLLVKVRPALELLRVRAMPLDRFMAVAFTLRSWPVARARVATGDLFANSYLRGPPSF